MCGILAVLTSDNNTQDINNIFMQSLQIMKHRGPDAVGSKKFVLNSNSSRSIFLGHHRLAIIDLSDAGIQPMTTEDGRLTIIFNGEIYNYIELREELVSYGEEFFSNTDTEVLLKGYKKFGVKFLSRLNGMFAFIIWDNIKEELLAVRDRFGIKPLYYSSYKGSLIFSSEIKSIVKLRNRDITPNHRIIWDFLTYEAIDRTDDTFFQEIKRFPAARYALFKPDNKVNTIQYWDIVEEINKLKQMSSFSQKTSNEHSKTVQELFFQAVRLRLRSDVTVGSCLSGGIDSSSIVSVINRLLPVDTKDIFQTFSIVFDESFILSEKEFIDIVTQQTNTNNNSFTPTIEDINNNFEKFLWHQEEPVTGLSPFGQFCVMQLASEKGVKVLLDGQGADELLAGYFPLSSYYFYELFKKFHWITLIKELRASRYKRNIKSFIAQLFPKFIHRKLVSRVKGVEKNLNKDFVNIYIKQPIPTLMLRRYTLTKALVKSLMNNFQHLLRFEDRNSMTFSIEARVPFLDYNLVTYILALPSKYIIKNGETKWIFRKAMTSITPQPILDRRDKIGFAVPELLWLQKYDPIFLADLEGKFHPLMQKYIEPHQIRKLSNKKNSLGEVDIKFLFRVACLNTWFNLFFTERE